MLLSMPGDVTQLLSDIDSGDPQAAEELLPLVYDELRRLAAHKMASEKPGQTLQATALVHEAWLKVAGSDRQRWRGREHFFSAAAEAIRRILVDNARRKLTVRHGGGLRKVELTGIDLPIAQNDEKCLRVAMCVAIPTQGGVLSLAYLPPQSSAFECAPNALINAGNTSFFEQLPPLQSLSFLLQQLLADPVKVVSRIPNPA